MASTSRSMMPTTSPTGGQQYGQRVDDQLAYALQTSSIRDAAGHRAQQKLDKLHSTNSYKPAPKCLAAVTPKLEGMAQGRQRKVRPEDVRDPDTVAGMKCKFDVDRETGAQAKALQRLDLMMATQSDVSEGKDGPLCFKTVKPRLEKKAEGRQRTVKPEDVRDPDTVAGMKCKVEVDREEEAKLKALKMADNMRFVSSDFV